MNSLKKIIKINKRYSLELLSSSIAFYCLISIGALTLLFLTFATYANSYYESFLINEILLIINSTLTGLMNDAFDNLNKSSINIVLIITLILSGSTFIHRFNNFTDKVYNCNKRSKISLFLNSLGLFLIVTLFIFFELLIIFYSKFFFDSVILINSVIFERIIILFFELCAFFLVITILYMYLPPESLKFKEVHKTSFIITLIIYLIFELFKVIFRILFLNNKIVALAFIFTLIGFLIFSIIYVICFGIINIYQNKIE